MHCFVFLLIFLSSLAFSQQDDCIIDCDTVFFTEPDKPQTILERKNDGGGLIAQRINTEKDNALNPFAITSHKPNYFLPFHYQSSIDGSSLSTDDEQLDDVEFVFQISVKFPIADDVIGRKTRLWGAYTQKAFWQSYNSDISAPFRETNHEPEVFVTMDLSKDGFVFLPDHLSFGFNHQSNGRYDEESRSWNRLFVEFLYEMENTVISVKPWYRLSESVENDDNPNIERYYGYGELNAIHIIGDYSIDLMLRNNLRSDNKGAVQVGFTFPLWGKSQGYIQYFTGYGQSLIEYDESVQSLGVGIILTNWL